MNSSCHSIFSDKRGAAAAEFALVLPLLLIITFGMFDVGRLMLTKTTVDSAMSDSARFAARLPMGCTALTNAADVSRVQTLARTGRSTTGGVPLLRGWTDNASVTISVTCLNNAGGAFVGAYDNMLNVPHVTVSTTVPFSWSLGGLLNLDDTNVVAGARQPWTG
jgi:Flp pilus assembly protein TadG